VKRDTSLPRGLGKAAFAAELDCRARRRAEAAALHPAKPAAAGTATGLLVDDLLRIALGGGILPVQIAALLGLVGLIAGLAAAVIRYRVAGDGMAGLTFFVAGCAAMVLMWALDG